MPLSSKVYLLLVLAYHYPFYISSFTILPPTLTSIISSNSIKILNAKDYNKPKHDENNALRIKAKTNASTKLFALSKIGVVGTGYISALTSKLSGLSGYNTWSLCTPGEEDIVRKLIFPAEEDSDEMKEMSKELNDNLILFPATDTEKLLLNLQDTEGIIIATDNPDEPMDGNVVQYIVENAPNLKRIILMSRNLNLKDNGFFVKASKVSANSNVWHADGNLVQRYQSMEKMIQDVCSKSDNSISYSFIRAGTLKGGGCGTSEASDEDGIQNTYYPQYLTKEFYTMAKRDIVSWNFLFDCRTRKVKLFKGDTMPGPGNKAVFTATSYEACDGDTSRCAIAECMVQCLEGSENLDFAIGTMEGREMPSVEEWKEMLSAVV